MVAVDGQQEKHVLVGRCLIKRAPYGFDPHVLSCLAVR